MFSWFGKRRLCIASFCRYVSSLSSGHTEGSAVKSVAHTCWFRVPEQQMKQYEILARGSGCIVQGKQKDVLWALVSAHVAAPFLFRNYFPQDWLSFVNENHCKHIFYWKTDQQKEREIETGNIIWKHDMLDVAAFGLEKQKVDDERVWESLSSQVVELKTLSEWQGKHVVVQGWQVQGEVGSGQEKIAPCALNGVIRVQQGIRYFVETKPCNAHHGMCGGPILLPESNTCVGILEGLVPDSSQLEHITQMEWKEFFHSIAGYAAFLEASVLVDFIDQLEKQRMEESFPGL